MKKLIVIISLTILSGLVFAGNPDRIGQAGATQLNINGWGKSSGWGWASMSSTMGLEALYTNLGGLAYTKQTDVIFSRTAWLLGTDININTFGFSQELGGNGVLAIGIMSYDIGDIEITTIQQPDGGIGTYKPRFTNISLGYSKRFTTSISGGIAFKVFSESITNAKAQGVALDAGIMYVTSSDQDDKLKKNDVKFGVSLKNVGPDAQYGGDGLTTKQENPELEEDYTLMLRPAKFNLPALINIGASYDIRMDKSEETYFHRLTPALTFTNNAFGSNQLTAGVEYGYKELFQLRTGYGYENGIFDYETRNNAFTGISGGFTFQVPVQKGSGTIFALDYSYRHSNPFGGSHTFGVRLNLDSAE